MFYILIVSYVRYVWIRNVHNLNNNSQINHGMICKRCGSTINDEHGCIYCITSDQIEISKDDSVQMQDMLLWLLTPEDKEKWTREETVVVAFGISIAIFLVGISIMNIIF